MDKTEKRNIIGKDERDNKGRFVAGNTGGGRPRMPDEVKNMLKAATPRAAQLLIDVIDDENQPMNLRIDCANKVIERIFGKPNQPIDGEIVTLSTTIDISLDEKLQLIESIRNG